MLTSKVNDLSDLLEVRQTGALHACGLSRKAIVKGIREISHGGTPLEGRIRRPGAGRKAITVSDLKLINALDEMIEGHTRGDPGSPLRWICKSTRLSAKGIR